MTTLSGLVTDEEYKAVLIYNNYTQYYISTLDMTTYRLQ